MTSWSRWWPVSTSPIWPTVRRCRRSDSPRLSGNQPNARLFSPTGRWYGAYCDGSLNYLPEGGPAVSIPGLVRQAVDSLDPPDPTLMVTPRHGKHVVNMKSWLAVDPDYWYQEREAVASAGRVSVTARLEPSASIWDMGNGETEICDNSPGLVWRAGMSEDRATCHYTYDWPSINPPDNTYDLTGTVRFDVSYTTNAPGSYGPFVPVERSTTETVRVIEIQAIAS